MACLREGKCIEAANKLFCEQDRRSGQLCAGICAVLQMQKWARKEGRGARWKSSMTVQCIHLAKLKADVNTCVLPRNLKVNSR